MRDVEQVRRGRCHVIPDLTRQALAHAVLPDGSVTELDPESLECASHLLRTDDLSESSDLAVRQTSEVATDLHHLLLVDQAAVGLSENRVHDRVNLLRLVAAFHLDVASGHAGDQASWTRQSVNVGKGHEVRDLVGSLKNVLDNSSGRPPLKLKDPRQIVICESL